MPNSFSLPLFSSIEFLVFIFLIYILLRVAVKVISYISVLRKPYLFIKKFFPLVDLAILITITFWFISWIFRDSDLLPIIIADSCLNLIELYLDGFGEEILLPELFLRVKIILKRIKKSGSTIKAEKSLKQL